MTGRRRAPVPLWRQLRVQALTCLGVCCLAGFAAYQWSAASADSALTTPTTAPTVALTLTPETPAPLTTATPAPTPADPVQYARAYLPVADLSAGAAVIYNDVVCRFEQFQNPAQTTMSITCDDETFQVRSVEVVSAITSTEE